MQSIQDIIELMEILEGRYGDTHQTFTHLRHFWEGKMWLDEASMTRSLVSVFRDLRHGGAEADSEPDVRVTLPLTEAITAKFMALLTPPPQISVITPPIGFNGLRKEETCRALADQNEKFLYGVWEQNRVRRHYARQSFYLPLMGCCFVGAHPDFDAKTVRYLMRSPENAYPVWDEGFENLRSIGFRWKVPADVAVQAYGQDILGYVDAQGASKGVAQMLGIGAKKQKKPIVDIIEFWDEDSKTVIVAGQKRSQVKHNLGFVPWVMPPFYDVPDQPFGKGVIEGNAALLQKMNVLDSLELQSVIENVFARLVIINPAVLPEDIDNGPGGVIPVGQGGDAKWLTPPAATTDLSASFSRSMDALQRGTHLPGSMYGEGVASSITTGKAQHESTLPTGNLVDYVQGNIADAWQRLNEYTIDMTGSVFKNRSVVYFGRQYTKEGIFSQPKQFQITLKGGDLAGWTRHELTFQPLLNLHEKVVIGLQLGGGGLVSKRWQRDQIGVVDNNAMQEEILAEMRLDQTTAALLGQAQAGAVPADYVEQAFLALEKGAPVPPPPAPPAAPASGGMAGPAPGPAQPGMLPPPPAPGAAAGPGAPPAGGPMMAGGRLTATGPGVPPAGQGPEESDSGLPSLPTPKQHYRFTLTGAIGDFQRIKKIQGQVWLAGEIVQRGGTDGNVEVVITEPVDKSTIIHGLPAEYHGHLQFRVSHELPKEPHVEVTPGAKATPAGGAVVPHPNEVAASGGGAEFSPDPVMATGSHSQPPLAANYGPGGGPSIRS